jgi:hypothetical protein
VKLSSARPIAARRTNRRRRRARPPAPEPTIRRSGSRSASSIAAFAPRMEIPASVQGVVVDARRPGGAAFVPRCAVVRDHGDQPAAGAIGRGLRRLLGGARPVTRWRFTDTIRRWDSACSYWRRGHAMKRTSDSE